MTTLLALSDFFLIVIVVLSVALVVMWTLEVRRERNRKEALGLPDERPEPKPGCIVAALLVFTIFMLMLLNGMFMHGD